MSCGISSGIGISCDALRRVGGVNKRAYAFNIEDVTYGFDANGNVNVITVAAYGGLYLIQSRKESHSGGYTLVEQTPGGNKFYQHDVILKTFPDSPEDDAALEQLAVAEVGIILETNNKEFILYGTDNGMTATAEVQNSGQAAGSDIGDSMTFAGSEIDIPKRVNLGDYQTTKDYLDSLVV